MNLPPTILALLNPIEERLNANGGVERWVRSAVLRLAPQDLSGIGPVELEQQWIELQTGQSEWRRVQTSP